MAAEAVAQDQVLVRLPRLGVAQQYGDQSKNIQKRLLKEVIKLTFLFSQRSIAKLESCGTHVFREYLHEFEKFLKRFYSLHMRPRKKFFILKNVQKSRDTVPKYNHIEIENILSSSA